MVKSFRIIVFSCFVVFFFSGCKKEEFNEEDVVQHLVFGRFNTSCAGSSDESCIEIFFMDKTSLIEDINDDLPQAGTIYNGNYVHHGQDVEHDNIEELLRANIPKSLIMTESGAVGSAPPWSSGFFYFEYKTNKIHRYWVIDGSFDGNLGVEMTNFISVLNQCVNMAAF